MKTQRVSNDYLFGLIMNEVLSNSIFHEIAEIIVNTNIWSKHSIESYDSKKWKLYLKLKKSGMISGVDK